MDQAIKTRINEAAAKIERRLSNFGPEDITLEDRLCYMEYLNENRKLFEEYQDLVYKLIAELDTSVQEQKAAVETLQAKETDLRGKFKQNTHDVKQKVSQLVTAYETSRPMNAAEVNNIDLLRVQEARLVEERQKAANL